MTTNRPIRVALVVPHIFLHRDILPHVIFSPGKLALELAEGLHGHGAEVQLYSPGPVDTTVPSVQADMSYFENELSVRGDSYIDLLKKHPFTFVSLARQVQSEIIAAAFKDANAGKFDVVHIYTNEEDTAMPFSYLCNKPVVFTHHDPFNFLIKYKNNFPKYPDLNWLSLSLAQRRGMPDGTNWIANIYHGASSTAFQPAAKPSNDYIAYLGRIVQPKGVHLAIKAIRKYNKTAAVPIKLKIAGKHYADEGNDTYWTNQIEPELDDFIEYVGFIRDDETKSAFLGNARGLIIPSIFDEPFGMVMIEALACGTPLIGLDSGAIPEIITNDNGIIVSKQANESDTIDALAKAIGNLSNIKRTICRQDFEAKFTIERMCQEHLEAYQKLVTK
jgi:glycosyltransferase involved in cell wall biosynthesis